MGHECDSLSRDMSFVHQTLGLGLGGWVAIIIAPSVLDTTQPCFDLFNDPPTGILSVVKLSCGAPAAPTTLAVPASTPTGPRPTHSGVE